MLSGEKWFYGSEKSESRSGCREEGGEGRAQYRPTTVCVSNPSPSVLLRKQEAGGEGKGGGGSGQECGCLTIFGPPSIWLCQFQHAHITVFYGNANQIFYWVSAEQSLSGLPRGIGCISVVELVLSCQAGTSLATKAQLFHDLDSTTGSDRGVLVNASLCSA